VLVALALNEVPIDVLAERLGTTRGALYKTLHDARRKLRRKVDLGDGAARPAGNEEADE
jgi:RNA polymerase sigma-70 factor (ECF subfamily)